MFIQLKNYTPEIYYRQSRDFQLLGRLYDIVLNSVSTNIDMIYSIPNPEYASSGLIELLALTLGFKPKHVYNVNQLKAVCSILPNILRVKGTLAALDLTCKALLNAEESTSIYKIYKNDDDPYNLIIIIPNLENTLLLSDLLDYILPTGLTCRIISSELAELNETVTKIGVTANKVNWNYTGQKYSMNNAASYWGNWNALGNNSSSRDYNIETRGGILGYKRPDIDTYLNNNSGVLQVDANYTSPMAAIMGDIVNSLIYPYSNNSATSEQPTAEESEPNDN